MRLACKPTRASGSVPDVRGHDPGEHVLRARDAHQVRITRTAELAELGGVEPTVLRNDEGRRTMRVLGMDQRIFYHPRRHAGPPGGRALAHVAQSAVLGQIEALAQPLVVGMQQAIAALEESVPVVGCHLVQEPLDVRARVDLGDRAGTRGRGIKM